MENKKASRYLAFDALKGLKEAIVSTDEFIAREKFPKICEDDISEMDVILYKSYLRKEAIYISYYYKGHIKTICDVVVRIDLSHHKLFLMVHGSIYMASITNLSLTEEVT
jgi:glutathionyl-hydroquinone reductase